MSSVDIEFEKQKIKEAYDHLIKNEISHDIEAAKKVISEEAVFLPPARARDYTVSELHFGNRPYLSLYSRSKTFLSSSAFSSSYVISYLK